MEVNSVQPCMLGKSKYSFAGSRRSVVTLSYETCRNDSSRTSYFASRASGSTGITIGKKANPSTIVAATITARPIRSLLVQASICTHPAATRYGYTSAGIVMLAVHHNDHGNQECVAIGQETKIRGAARARPVR